MNHASVVVKAVAKVLKAKYSNLTVEETLDLAYKILDAIQEAQDAISR